MDLKDEPSGARKRIRLEPGEGKLGADDEVDGFPVPIKRNLQVPPIEGMVKKIEEASKRYYDDDFYISGAEKEELKIWSASLWVKWYYREVDFDKTTLDLLLFFIPPSQAATTLFTLSRVPLNEKKGYKWKYVKNFFSGGPLPYRSLPQVKGGNFIHYDRDQYVSSENLPSIERDISGVSFADFEKPAFSKRPSRYPNQEFDAFFIEPKLSYFDKPGTSHMACMKSEMSFYFTNDQDVFFFFEAGSDEENQGPDTLFFLKDDLTSNEMLTIQRYLFDLIDLCDRTHVDGKAVLVPVGIGFPIGAHLVCLEIRTLETPRTVAGVTHYYEFTWLDNNSSFGNSILGQAYHLFSSYRNRFGSMARKRCTFVLSQAMSKLKQFLIKNGGGPVWYHYETFEKDKKNLRYLFESTVEERENWCKVVNSTPPIVLDLGIQVNNGYENTDHFIDRKGFCVWWTYAFILDMLQNDIDLRTYYKEHLLPFEEYRKQQRGWVSSYRKTREEEKEFILAFYAYCCCFEALKNGQVVGPLQKQFGRNGPMMVNDGLIIEEWTGKNGKIEAQDRKIFVAFDGVKVPSTAAYLMNHTAASVVKERKLPYRVQLHIDPRLKRPKPLQRQFMDQSKALREKRKRESLLMLPGVIGSAKEKGYYVTVDAISTFTGVYYQVQWPSQVQIDAVKTQTRSWLSEIEEANVFWYGEKEETPLGKLLAALIDVVGGPGKLTTKKQWTRPAAGMVLLMWAEMTQTKSSKRR